MIRFEKSIIINAAPHQVFNFIANPANNWKWRTEVIDVTSKAVPLAKGDTYEEIIDFGGVQDCVVELIEIVPNEKLVFKVISGWPYHPVRKITFESMGDDTRVTAQISAHTDGFSRLIQPIAERLFSIRWENSLFALKHQVEKIMAPAV